MKKVIFVIICYLWLVNSSFSQSYNRMENPNYAKTTFLEDFNSSSLDPNIWNPSTGGIRDGAPSSSGYSLMLFNAAGADL